MPADVRGSARAVAMIFALIVTAGVCVSFLYQSETVAMPKIFAQRLTFLDGDLRSDRPATPPLVFYFGAAAQYRRRPAGRPLST